MFIGHFAMGFGAKRFASLYMALSHSGLRVAIVIVTLIFSHWVLDVLSHRPDMPITLGKASKIGVGLWNYPIAAPTRSPGIARIVAW